jgi:hypothetical protein
MTLTNDLKKILEEVGKALNKHEVECMLVGGFAVGFYGFQRISGPILQRPHLKLDLDFWYKPSLDNFIRLSNALIDMGVPRHQLDSIVFDPLKTYLKIPLQNFHLDFLCQMKGLASYQDCKQQAQIVAIGEQISLNVIGYNDLIKNKIAIDRHIDREDVRELEKRNPGKSSLGMSE